MLWCQLLSSHPCVGVICLSYRPDTSAFSALRLTPYEHPPQHWRWEGESITDPTSQPQPQPHPSLPQPGQDITNNNQNDNSSTNNNHNMTVTDTHPPPLTPDSPRVPLKISVVPCREIGGKEFLRTEVSKVIGQVMRESKMNG